MSDTVLIGGVFDPLHAGHLAYIQEAKKHGDVMCVLSDAAHKHPVLVPWGERAQLLWALGVEPIWCNAPGPVSVFLETLKPKKYIKGKDWEGRLPPEEVAICNSLGIEIVYTDTSRQSSSQLLADYERRRNTEKLAAFESWVRQQQPAEKPWAPVTDYSWEARKVIEGPHADILAAIVREEFAGCRPAKVLDYGCGLGYLMLLLQERGVHAYGWDPAYAPATTYASQNDLVICREVLEHLTVPALTKVLRELITLSRRLVYVTTRFTSKPHLLDFDERDDLDPTHISMCNQTLLRTIFVLEGCTRRVDLEDKLDHRKLGRCLVYEVPA